MCYLCKTIVFIPMKKVWEFVHNFVAHPLMALTNNSTFSLQFHDWTAKKAF